MANCKYCNINILSGYICHKCHDQIGPLSISQEAESLINGDRRKDYGPAKKSFENIALAWNAIRGVKNNQPITAQEVALMMASFKLIRESNNHKRDNLVDAIGYILLMENIINESCNTDNT